MIPLTPAPCSRVVSAAAPSSALLPCFFLCPDWYPGLLSLLPGRAAFRHSSSGLCFILLTFTEFRVNSREVAVFVPLVVSLRNMRRMPSTTLDPDIDEAAGRLELVELSAGVLLALLRGVLVGEVSLMLNVSDALEGEEDWLRTLCPPATRLIWLEGMSSAARMEEDIVIIEKRLVELSWLS